RYSNDHTRRRVCIQFCFTCVFFFPSSFNRVCFCELLRRLVLGVNFNVRKRRLHIGVVHVRIVFDSCFVCYFLQF
ncbi:hypothetical protein C0J52_24878, partial [Blattella germanica]